MKSWRLAIPLLALAAGGCTVGQHHAEVTALQNENRDLEDTLYRQQAALKDLCQQNDALRRRLQESSSSGPEISPNHSGASAPDGATRLSVAPGRRLPSGEVPGLLRSAPGGPGANGVPKGPEEETPPASSEAPPFRPGAPASEAPPFLPPSAAPSAAKPQPDAAAAPASGALRTLDPSPQFGRALQGDNTKVAAITVHPIVDDAGRAGQPPGGAGRNGQPPGGDGITLWIEPRDQAGNLVRAAAPLAVVVLDPDPSMAGPAARVGRWDFASEATAAFYRRTATAEGIFLELTWPGDPPKHRTLEVFVRYTTDDGRKLEARRTIHLDLADQPRVESRVGWSRRAAPVPVETTAYPTDGSSSASAKEGPAAADAMPTQRPRKKSSDGDESAETSKLELPAWSPDRP
jgi:hypothetical protein